MFQGLSSANQQKFLLQRFKPEKQTGKLRKLRTEKIVILGWKGEEHKIRVTNNWNKDWWFSLDVAKSKSFATCYDRNFLVPEMQCEYTDNSSRYNESDAVLFRGIRMHMIPIPKYRFPHQKWIFVEHEPPYRVYRHFNLSRYNGLFNFTATYSFDSDIPNLELMQHCIRNITKHKQLDRERYTEKKRSKSLVAWFVSDCKTQSERMLYVKELQNYVSVDIYGRCGDLKCGNWSTWSSDDCFQRLLHENGSYKFYLSFENSLCEDYVTEKLWTKLNLDVIPIVRGGVDYANLMPKDSFIDVKDFESPKDLADYLHYLDKHDDLYNQYIRNKNSLICEPVQKIPWECILCKTLHELKGVRKVVHSLESFWGSRRCIQPNILC